MKGEGAGLAATFFRQWRHAAPTLPVVFVGAAFGLALLFTEAYVNDDFLAHLLLARKCVEQEPCLSLGPPASIFGLVHGALWIRLLALALRTGGALSAVQLAVAVQLLVAALVVLIGLRRHISPAARWLLLALGLTLGPFAVEYPRPENPALLLLPLALMFSFVAHYVQHGRVWAIAAASGAMTFAISANLATVIFLPFVLALAVLFARRPVRDLAWSVMSAGICALESRDALVHNASSLPWPFLALGLAGTGAVLLLALWMRPRVAGIAGSGRVVLVMEAALVYVVSVVLLGVLLSGRFVAPRFFAPAVVPMIFLMARDAGGWSRRRLSFLFGASMLAALGLGLSSIAWQVGPLLVPVFALWLAAKVVLRAVRRRSERAYAAPVSGGLLFALAAVPPLAALPDLAGALPCDPSQNWTVREVEAVGERLYAQGRGFGQVGNLVHGPAMDALLAMLDAMDPFLLGGEKEPASRQEESLLVMKASDDVIARTTGVRAAIPASRGRSLLVVEVPAYLRRERMRLCVVPRNAGAQRADCRELDANDLRPSRSSGNEMWGASSFSGDEPVVARFSMPVQTLSTGEAHFVYVAPSLGDSWRIRTVTGVPYAGELPGREVLIEGGQDASGEIEFEAEVSAQWVESFSWFRAPSYMEVPASNEHLLESLRANGRPRCPM